jgi:hypothetical protein
MPRGSSLRDRRDRKIPVWEPLGQQVKQAGLHLLGVGATTLFSVFLIDQYYSWRQKKQARLPVVL